MENLVLTNSKDTLKILIIDDDELFCTLCTRYLKRATGQKNYLTQTALLASDGMSLCLEQAFDCLILDYRLPDITGTELLNQLHVSLGEKTPPAIILTAGSVEEAAVNAIRARAADFMAKSEVTRVSLTRALDNAIVKDRLQRSVSEQNEQLKTVNRQLEKSAEEIRQFYHNVSHEIKTPLTGVKEFLNLLNEEVCGPITEKQSEVLGFALSGCEQIALHFDDLLDITCIETGKMKLRLSMNSVFPLIRQCILAIAPEANHRRITIVNDTSESLPQVLLDAHRFNQIVTNLLTNALKFTGENGTITITSEIINDEFILSVSDTGCGIEEDDIDRIFDRLYQVPLGEEHEASSTGLGLGLSIARDISRMHKGDLTVSSIPGIGSTFTVSLPLSNHCGLFKAG